MKRTVLVVDDEKNMQTVMRMVLEEAGHRALLADNAEAALAQIQNPNLDVIVTDLRMPGMSGEDFVRRARDERPDVPVIVVTAHGTIRSAVERLRDGAADYLTKPFEPEQFEMSVTNAIRLHDILRENAQLKAAITQAQSGRRIIGESASTARLLEEIRRVAPYKTSVLITGESGTGKELVARTLHEMSPRSDKPWVAINCSAIPRDLLESELFGYVKGAFSGATQTRAGRLEQAQGGTLFLDEIGDLDLALQAKLLRVLQEREYSPLGSDQLREIDIRFLAASNRDLEAFVHTGQFREDLYYRLNVYHIDVPPLRNRQQDVPLLAEHFLQQLMGDTGKLVKGFTSEALDTLARYHWPGNIRELRNAIERALLSARSDRIALDDLPLYVRRVQAAAANDAPTRAETVPLDDWLAEVERRAIQEALAACGGVQARAARRLGISERSLWHRIKKLNIQISRVVN